MGPIRRKKNQNTERYDPELLENWTIDCLKQELRRKGIHFPQNARRMALVRFLRNNHEGHTLQSQSSATNSPRADVDLFGSARSHDATGNTTPNDLFSISRTHNATNINNTI